MRLKLVKKKIHKQEKQVVVFIPICQTQAVQYSTGLNGVTANGTKFWVFSSWAELDLVLLPFSGTQLAQSPVAAEQCAQPCATLSSQIFSRFLQYLNAHAPNRKKSRHGYSEFIHFVAQSESVACKISLPTATVRKSVRDADFTDPVADRAAGRPG